MHVILYTSESQHTWYQGPLPQVHLIHADKTEYRLANI